MVVLVVVVRAYLSGLISDLREERGSDGLECSHHHLQLQTSCFDSSQIKKNIKKVLNYLASSCCCPSFYNWNMHLVVAVNIMYKVGMLKGGEWVVILLLRAGV